jgi:hypothetical protein
LLPPPPWTMRAVVGIASVGGGFFGANASEIFAFLVAFDDNNGGDGGGKSDNPNDGAGTRPCC